MRRSGTVEAVRSALLAMGVALLVTFGLPVSESLAGASLQASASVASALQTPGAPPVASAWPVESPESQSMDPDLLEEAHTYAFEPSRNTQGVVVVRNGVIVSEWYADGADADSWATSWSVSKSFTSAMVGIAIDEGYIPSVDVPMTTYFPDWVGTPREDITLRHVLTMSSGLQWNESYSPGSAGTSNIIQMVAAHLDQLAYAASTPLAVPPGTFFNYSSGDSMLLSGVLEQATGVPAHEYAREKIFEPIGMDQAELWTDAAGHGLTYCCVDTTTRGFARFGQLYLQGGRWGDEQVVPSSWVAESISPSSASDGYGYQWWLSTVSGRSVFTARGHDGQYVYVVPSLELVVARNGTYYKSTGPASADPNLVVHLPPQGLIPGAGSVPPSSWSDSEFLGSIIASVDTSQPTTTTTSTTTVPSTSEPNPTTEPSSTTPDALSTTVPTHTSGDSADPTDGRGAVGAASADTGGARSRSTRSHGDLASTGSDARVPVTVAFVLLTAGIALTGLRRRAIRSGT